MNTVINFSKLNIRLATLIFLMDYHLNKPSLA